MQYGRRMKDRTNPVDRIVAAVKNPGPNPMYHHNTMRRHRLEWPELWKAIDDLIEESEHGTR